MTKEVERVLGEIRKKPYMLKMGKGLLSKRLNTSPLNIVEAKNLFRLKPAKSPRILIFDVETAPMKAYVWGRWKQNISLDATISEWFMICWSAKWLYSEEIEGDVLTPEEAILEDDFRIVQHLWELINKADIVIAYNGKRADIPWMNTRFVVHNMMPPKPYIIIDPCEVAKKNFGFSSNKLDALAGYFGIPHKLETSFELWKNCLEGDNLSLMQMFKYNLNDTAILEEVYLRLRPWIKGVNLGAMSDSNVPVCSCCTSSSLDLIPDQYYYTSIGKYRLYRCKNCGAVTRGRENLNKGKLTVTMCGH